MPLPFLLGAAALFAGVLVVASWWDELRSAVFCWLKDHGFVWGAKALLLVDQLVSRGMRRVVAIARPAPHLPDVVVEERWVSEEELSPELRARRDAVVYELEMEQ
jgi:hypothetical protein